MRRLQIEHEMTETIALVDVQKKSKAKRQVQAWHCLVLVCTAFWIVVGLFIITSDFAAIAIVALLILAAFSSLVIALAWAFQNNI